METRPFRFGVVAGFAPSAAAWAAIAKKAESLGYSTLLTPDTPGTFAPFSALAAVATVTTKLRVGTFVLDTPLRNPATVAWEALTLDTLSGGRLELGLGTGRHTAAEAERLGMDVSSPSERLERLAETIRVVEQACAEPAGALRPVQEPHPPFLVAAYSQRALELAAERADIVTFAIPPDHTEDQLGEKVEQLRELAGDRFDDLELSANLVAIGDELPDWLTTQLGKDKLDVPVDKAAALLSGTPEQMADTLRRRRESTGISYLMVNGAFMDELAPVIELLADE